MKNDATPLHLQYCPLGQLEKEMQNKSLIIISGLSTAEQQERLKKLEVWLRKEKKGRLSKLLRNNRAPCCSTRAQCGV